MLTALWLALKAATVAILAVAAAASWRQKHRREAPFLTVLFVALALYRATTLGPILVAAGLSPLGVMMLTQCSVALIPPSLAAGILLSNGRLTPTQRTLALLYAIPLATVVLTLTNSRHGLIWAPSSFDAAFARLEHPEWGPWFTMVFAPFSYGLMLVTMLVAAFQLASPMRVFRQQAVALLFAIALPTGANLVTTFGLARLPFVVLEAAFLLGSLILAVGLVRFQLFKVPPIAHDAILASIGDGVLVLGADDHVVEANAAACTLLGLHPTQALGPLDTVLVRHAPLATQVRGPHSSAFAYAPTPERQVEVEARTLNDRQGRHAGRLVLLRDLTEQRRAEATLREREALLDTIVQSSPNGILTVTPCGGEAGWPRDFECVQANPAAIRFLGHAGPLVGAKLSEAPLVHRALLMQILRSTVLHGTTSTLVLDAPVVGRWYQVTSTPAERAALVTVVDITDQKEREDAIASMANLDPLTRLFNRRGFEADARTMLARLATTGDAVALFYLDLDGFKPVNDTYGHAHGDDLLVQFSARLRASFRDDALIARMGGDEFVVLAPAIASANVPAIVERVRVKLSESYLIDRHDIWCPATIGSAWSMASETSLETLLHHADRQMLERKAGTRHSRGGVRLG